MAWKPGRSPVGHGVLTQPIPARAPSADSITIPATGATTPLIRARDIAVGGISLNSQVSNTLSIWTPAIAFGGASVGATYTTQFGIFFTIGNLAIANFQLQLSSKGTSTGNATVTGLPILALNIGLGAIFQSLTPLAYGNMATTANLFSAGIVDNTQVITLMMLDNGTNGMINMTDANFNNTSAIGGTCIYIGQT